MEFLRCNWKNSVIMVFKRGGKMKKNDVCICQRVQSGWGNIRHVIGQKETKCPQLTDVLAEHGI
jgi:hypothetical protein